MLKKLAIRSTFRNEFKWTKLPFLRLSLVVTNNIEGVHKTLRWVCQALGQFDCQTTTTITITITITLTITITITIYLLSHLLYPSNRPILLGHLLV